MPGIVGKIVLQTAFASVAAIILFLYSLQGFSSEVQTVGGEGLKRWLTRVD